MGNRAGSAEARFGTENDTGKAMRARPGIASSVPWTSSYLVTGQVRGHVGRKGFQLTKGKAQILSLSCETPAFPAYKGI